MMMNEMDIDDAVDRWAVRERHPVLGPAALTLASLRDVTNANSDGWCYWAKPSNAAKQLQDLLHGERYWDARYGDREDITAERLVAALRPVKAFRTKMLKTNGSFAFDIVTELPPALF